MRAVFIGTVEVSWHCLKAILEHDQVVAIYSLPAARASTVSAFRSFEDLAEQHGVPLFFTENINAPEVVAHLRELTPEVIYCIGWPRLLRQAVLGIPTIGCVGMHSSLLPKYRGGAPVNWGLIAGEQRWGISLMFLGEGADTGDLIGQVSFDIGPHETCAGVYDRVAEASIRALHDVIPKLERGAVERVAQDDNVATQFRKRLPADGEIDWRGNSNQIHNWVRALTLPYPGAFTYLADGRRVVVWESETIAVEGSGAPCGRILEVIPFRGIVVQCGLGRLLVRRITIAGGVSMPASVWAAHMRDALPAAFVFSDTRQLSF